MVNIWWLVEARTVISLGMTFKCQLCEQTNSKEFSSSNFIFASNVYNSVLFIYEE